MASSRRQSSQSLSLPESCLASPAAEACASVSHPHPLPGPSSLSQNHDGVEGRRVDLPSALGLRANSDGCSGHTRRTQPVLGAHTQATGHSAPSRKLLALHSTCCPPSKVPNSLSFFRPFQLKK